MDEHSYWSGVQSAEVYTKREESVNSLFRAKIGLSTTINNLVVFLQSPRPFLVCGFLFSHILRLGCKRAALSLDIPTASQARRKENGDCQRKDTLPGTLPPLARTVSHGDSWL